MKKVLVIGQTPPPHHGQALMIERLVKANFDRIEVVHLRMSFSKSMNEVGKFGLRKALHAVGVIVKAVFFRFKYGINTLYFPPAGPNTVPVIRDIIILLMIRPFFKTTVFHFRAAGVSEFVQRTNPILRSMAKLAYNRATCGIQLSALNPPDAKYFKSHQIKIVKNGLEDSAKDYLPITRSNDETFQILYVGALIESKGILVLLNAVAILNALGHGIKLKLLGEFKDLKFEPIVHELCQTLKIQHLVSFEGVKVGKEKFEYFVKSDVLCFPTFYESESFGNVLVEAMMFELPIVSTLWRAIPEIVEDGVNGFLVETKNAQATAKSLESLITQPSLRKVMGEANRDKYLNEYSLDTHIKAMEEVLYSVS
ncbi:MAG: glycosyltransferase [Bacteroidota bacterium]